MTLGFVSSVLLVLLVGCSDPSGPEPISVDPPWKWQHETKKIQIMGDRFFGQPRSNYNNKNEAYTNQTFTVMLGDHTLQDVKWLGKDRLEATVPNTLPLGVFVLAVIGPQGQRGILPAAFSVRSTAHDAGPDEGPADGRGDVPVDLGGPDRGRDIGVDVGVDIDVPDQGSDAPTAPTCTPHTNLKLCVTFSKTSGSTVYDESGNSYNGTLGGKASVVAGGKVGPAVSITNTGTDVVDFGDVLASLSNVTAMAWVNYTTTPKGWTDIVHKWQDTSVKGFWLGGSKNADGYEFWINSAWISAKHSTVGWNHIAGTYDASAGVMKLYVNGVQVATSTGVSNIGRHPRPLQLGWYHPSIPPVGYTGLTDEVRIYDVARSQADICRDAGGVPQTGGGCKL
jgi:hypothetical protein